MSDKTERISDPLPPDAQLISMQQAQRASGVSKPPFYEHFLQSGLLKTVLVGTRRLTTPLWLAQAIAKLGEHPAPPPSTRPNNRHRPIKKTKQQARASTR